MDQITHTVRSAYWKDIILQCQSRPTGMSAKQWMRENRISEKSYYYWQRKFRKEAYDQMNPSLAKLPVVSENAEISFAEIHIPEPESPVADISPETLRPAAVVKTAAMTVALSNDISASLLSRLLEEVRHA